MLGNTRSVSRTCTGIRWTTWSTVGSSVSQGVWPTTRGPGSGTSRGGGRDANERHGHPRRVSHDKAITPPLNRRPPVPRQDARGDQGIQHQLPPARCDVVGVSAAGGLAPDKLHKRSGYRSKAGAVNPVHQFLLPAAFEHRVGVPLPPSPAPRPPAVSMPDTAVRAYSPAFGRRHQLIEARQWAGQPDHLERGRRRGRERFGYSLSIFWMSLSILDSCDVAG